MPTEVAREDKKNQDHQPNMAPTKNAFSCKFGPTIRDFASFARIWENMVFSAPTQTNFSEFALFQGHRSKIAQICVLPILTRKPNTNECTPLNKKTVFLGFLRCPPKISKCHQNLLRERVIFNKIQTEFFKINNFKQIRNFSKTIF